MYQFWASIEMGWVGGVEVGRIMVGVVETAREKKLSNVNDRV